MKKKAESRIKKMTGAAMRVQKHMNKAAMHHNMSADMHEAAGKILMAGEVKGGKGKVAKAKQQRGK